MIDGKNTILDKDGYNRNRSYLKNKYPTCKQCNCYMYLDDVDYSLKDRHKMNKFIKSSIRVDYKGGICKDFRDTGFCGFGDNCQFLHDRSDLYMGWELDNIFNMEEHRKNRQ